MQSLPDQLIRDVRAVEIRGVDVVAAARHRLAKDGTRSVGILGRTEYARPRELHGAIAEPLHDAVAEGECAGLVNGGHDRPPSSGLLAAPKQPVGLDDLG